MTILSEKDLAEIMRNAVILPRRLYSHSDDCDIYLSYSRIGSQIVSNTAICVQHGKKTGMLLAEGNGVFALFKNENYGCFRQILSQHWSGIKEMYVLSGQNLAEAARTLDLNLVEV